jgi:hypothetical protein
MTTLAIKQGRPHNGANTFHVVLRRHDLSGTDYEPLVAIDRSLAIALGSRGVAVRARDAVQARGRPGIVMDADEVPEGHLAEIRADIADPTTVMETFRSNAGMISEVLGGQDMLDLAWVGVPPAV